MTSRVRRILGVVMWTWLVALPLHLRAQTPPAPSTSESWTEGGAQREENANEAAPTLVLAILPAKAQGVDSLVAAHLERRLSFEAQRLGYRLLAPEATEPRVLQGKHEDFTRPAELWSATQRVGAQRGVGAKVWAQHGRYVLEIVVASLDGTGPFTARGQASVEDFDAVVAVLLERALPPPARWDAAAAAEWAQARPSPPSPSPPPPRESETVRALAPKSSGRAPSRAQRNVSPRFALALQTESAVGTSSRFYNHLLGTRLDVRILPEFFFGAYIAYANLEGRNGRAQSVLSYGQIEYRVPVGVQARVRIPLRLGVGYLLKNGPLIRAATGLHIQLSERVALGLDLVTPTFWVLQDSTAVSLNFGCELVVGL